MSFLPERNFRITKIQPKVPMKLKNTGFYGDFPAFGLNLKMTQKFSNL